MEAKLRKDTSRPSELAHVRQDERGEYVIHDLEDHLRGVAQLAKQFALDFGSTDWAYIAGLWHDLGKYSKEFQRRIKSVSGYDLDAYLGDCAAASTPLLDQVIAPEIASQLETIGIGLFTVEEIKQ